jgi:hypothetical protein
MLIGTFGNVELIDRYTTDGVCNWNPVFVINAIASVALVIALSALFRDDVKEVSETVSDNKE